jgi:LysM repeat protein
MESRTIKIINNRTQSQTTLYTSAATLGELKNELDSRGIDYDGLDFYCGEMRAELKEDSAPLPEKVMWKGEEKNSLTFLLTPTKKISSGSRRDIYATIKKYNLQEVVKAKTGANYTQVSNDTLEKIIKDHVKDSSKGNEDSSKGNEGSTTCHTKTIEERVKNLEEAFLKLVVALYDMDFLDRDIYCELVECIEDSDPEDDFLSQSEIDEMFGSWAK